MAKSVIEIAHLSKRYLVGARESQPERYTALRDVITHNARSALTNWMTLIRRLKASPREEAREFWALKDVSFTVQQGEVLGVVGRNGAGKSTLLKILSRITEPTAGRAILRGRVASLLEVGTGFHPELTGRENIFLNGAMLGMTRSEIRRKFDEIVAFAEIDRFLDTPVKRYSSGMYVRLAFAVAAHLEPEILVVDEVLAVGDAEFQKKCLGKMHDVSRGGRTVLFVSHNMAAIKSLTTHAVLLDAGRLVCSGPTAKVIESYTRLVSKGRAAMGDLPKWGSGKHTAVRWVRLLGEDGEPVTEYMPGKPIRVEIVFDTDGTRSLSLELFLTDSNRMRIGIASTYQLHGVALPEKGGRYRLILALAPLWLATGEYALDVATSIVNVNWDHLVESATEFEVRYCNPFGYAWDFKQSYGFGQIALLSECPIEFSSISQPTATSAD